MNTVRNIRVPGKIMLSGEYAVLFGERALAFTIDSFLEVEASVSADALFHLSSDIWTEELHFKNFEDLNFQKQKSPLIFALQEAQKIFQNPPLHVKISSELDLSAGMGSSSAVILACCFASSLFSEKESSKEDIAKLAYTVQKSLQGHASGYDVLTQCVGGLVSLQSREPWPGQWENIVGVEKQFSNFIHIFAGGKGSPTGPLLKETLLYLETSGTRSSFLSLSEDLCSTFLNFFKTGELEPLIQANRKHREAMSQFPHFPEELASDLEKIDGCDSRWTFKTTGAGGEDSILLIGNTEDLQEAKNWMKQKRWYELPYTFNSEGLHDF